MTDEKETVFAKNFSGERALFRAKNMNIENATFHDGESPLKHSENISLTDSAFRYKYPLWYSKNVSASGGVFAPMSRAGIWYTDGVELKNTIIESPKNFRRCRSIFLESVQFTDAAETLWHCENVKLSNVSAKGDYFLMDSAELKIDSLNLSGNYPFDGVKNAEISNSRLISKDAFWNAENIVIRDSYISGEYFGWNSKNITLINCTVESHQGFCYIENLVMKNCKILNTDLAFEYSIVDIESLTAIDSVKNPIAGTIRAPEIRETIMQSELINPERTVIITGWDGAGK